MKSGRIIFIFLLLFVSLFSQEIYFPKAKVSYDFFDQHKEYYSNDIKFDTSLYDSPKVTFFRYDLRGKNFLTPPVKYINNEKYFDMSLPKVSGNTIQLDSIKVAESLDIAGFDSFFMEITDAYSNKDKTKIDSINITFENSQDYEKVVFLETDVDSGIFRGYINPTNLRAYKQDGMLYLVAGEDVKVDIDDRYTTFLKVSTLLRNLTVYSNTNIWLEDRTLQKEISDAQVLKNKIIVKNSSNDFVENTFFIEIDKNLKLVQNSIKVDNKPVTYTQKEHNYSFNLKLDPNSQKSITFISRAGALNKTEILNKVQYDENVLELKSKVIDEFFKKSSMIFGKVAFGKKGIGGIKIYLEDGTSTLTDKNGKYHFDDIDPDFHVVKVDTNSIESRFEITSCKDSVLYAKSQTTMFVDTSVSHIAKADFCLKYTGKKRKKDIKKKYPKAKKMPKYSKSSFLKKENKILWPPKDFVPSFPALKLAFMHKSDLKAKVYINSKEVDKLLYDGFEISKEKDYKIEKYRGVLISKGDNSLTIKLYKNKKLIQVLSRNIHFSTAPVKAKVVEELSSLKADASRPAIVAVRLYDKDGYPVRKGIIGNCFVSEPYYFYKDIKSIKTSPLSLSKKAKYKVENDGIVYIKLNPTSISGSLKLHFDFMESGRYLTTWLEPVQESWILVGFAKGSLGYKTIKESMTNTKAKSAYHDGKISLFAKGKVSDDVIMTLAYNSAKKVDLTKLENSNLKKSYLVYGDDSKQSDEAPSIEKLYLKLEKKNFYILFGDFKTGLSDVKLASYNVKTNGLKSEFKGKKFSYTAFVSQSRSIHLKDEILPDGTSGKYYLNNRDIIENSESISIVTRDKDNYEKVIEQQILAKDIDYNIDYYDGYIYFKEPIFSSDENFNPKFIVVDYEKNTDDVENLTYGTSMRYDLNKKVSLGTSYVKSKRGLIESELQGIDVMLSLYKDIDLKMEVAQSKEDDIKAVAHSEELVYSSRNFSVKATSSYKEKEFGIENQENNRDLDKKIDTLKAAYNITKKDQITLKKQYYTQISTQERERKEELLYRHDGKSYMIEGGTRKITKDSISDKKAVLSLRKNFFNSRVVTQLTHTKSLDPNNMIEADETIFKVNYLLSSKVKVFAQSRLSELDDEKTRLFKSGLNITPWKGATINTSLVKEQNTDTFSTYAEYGILQDISYSKNLSFSLGYDEKHGIEGESNFADYQTYSGGIRYIKNKWHYNLKTEYKDSIDDKLAGSVAAYSTVSKDLSLALGLKGEKVFSQEKPSYEIATRFSVAYRPQKGDFIVLNRSDIKFEKSKEEKSDKVINNTFINKKFNKAITLAGQLGLKYVNTTMDDQLYTDLVGLVGLSFIYDINKKFQINSQVSMSFSLENETYEYSAGSALGYSPFKDSLVYFGYNIEGFDDEDFESEVYRQSGPYINFLLKFDEFSLAERAKRTIE
ncbi:MAG: hypothetical protein GXO30_05020 [Epsilonproteobacteria bacterium]|nr:hypothetical protein [Campylobacterota bacterium]